MQHTLFIGDMSIYHGVSNCFLLFVVSLLSLSVSLLGNGSAMQCLLSTGTSMMRSEVSELSTFHLPACINICKKVMTWLTMISHDISGPIQSNNLWCILKTTSAGLPDMYHWRGKT